MIKFDKKWVKCFWEDELEGKEVFVADDIADLRGLVEHEQMTDTIYYGECHKNDDEVEASPFRINEGSVCWRFCYYDPYYKYRAAFEQGQYVEARYEDETVNVTRDTLEEHDVSVLHIFSPVKAEERALPKVGTAWQHVTKSVTAMVTAIYEDQTYPIMIVDDWCSTENFYKNWRCYNDQ